MLLFFIVVSMCVFSIGMGVKGLSAFWNRVCISVYNPNNNNTKQRTLLVSVLAFVAEGYSHGDLATSSAATRIMRINKQNKFYHGCGRGFG